MACLDSIPARFVYLQDTLSSVRLWYNHRCFYCICQQANTIILIEFVIIQNVEQKGIFSHKFSCWCLSMNTQNITNQNAELHRPSFLHISCSKKQRASSPPSAQSGSPRTPCGITLIHLPSRKYLQICLPLCSTVCWLMNSWLIFTHFFTGLPSCKKN